MYNYLFLLFNFGMIEVADNALTIKSVGDAIVLRNHVISMLEQADIEHDDPKLRRSLMTFVIVGGGFSGVEVAGELNDFVRESIEHFYHDLDRKDARIILVNSGGRILPEVTEDLAHFALQQLRKNGVEVMLNTRLIDATQDSVKLNNGSLISCNTLIWAGGALPDDKLIGNLPCDHDKSGRIVANKYLEINALYYLGNLPTVEKKLRVTVDWTIDLFFKRDVSRLRTFTEEDSVKASTEILR
jgi:NADH dehydrogenase